MSASIPEEWAGEWGDTFMRCTKDAVGNSFLRWSAKWKPRWWAKSTARMAYEDGFEIGARSAFATLQEVQNALASGILTEGGDAEQAPGDSLSSPTGEAGDAPTGEPND